MAPIDEEEARYQAIKLVQRHPSLTDLLFKLQWEGVNWVTLLKRLREAVPNEQPDSSGLPIAI
jgi:hypothetical protein